MFIIFYASLLAFKDIQVEYTFYDAHKLFHMHMLFIHSIFDRFRTYRKYVNNFYGEMFMRFFIRCAYDNFLFVLFFPKFV